MAHICYLTCPLLGDRASLFDRDMWNVTDGFAGHYDVAAVLATDPSLFHNIWQVLGVIGGRAKEPIVFSDPSQAGRDVCRHGNDAR